METPPDHRSLAGELGDRLLGAGVVDDSLPSTAAAMRAATAALGPRVAARQAVEADDRVVGEELVAPSGERRAGGAARPSTLRGSIRPMW